MGDYETTWDGLPISKEKPIGAAIVVFRRKAGGFEYLVLHRTLIPNAAVDWAWGPPAGARLPGEPVAECVARELREETGLSLPTVLTTIGDDSFLVYYAEAPSEAVIVLSEEHDQFTWLPSEAACQLCLPSVVRNQIQRIALLIGDSHALGESLPFR